MDKNSIVNLTQTIMQNAIGLSVLSLLIIGLLIWVRTRSPHILMTRLWRLFVGTSECGVPDIDDFLQRRSALLHFRFMTGLSVRTLAQVEKVCAWTVENDEDLGHVRACGKYFDLEKPSLRPVRELPSIWQLVALLISAGLLTVGLALAMGGAVTDRAWVRFTNSGTWFTLDAVSAIPLVHGVGFKLNQCRAVDEVMKSNPGFGRDDIETICRTAAAGQIGPYVAATVQSQRVTAFVAILFLLSALCWIVGWMRQGGSAHEMRKRLAARMEPGA